MAVDRKIEAVLASGTGSNDNQCRRCASVEIERASWRNDAFRGAHRLGDSGDEDQGGRWTKSADDILESIERFRRRTLNVHAQSG